MKLAEICHDKTKLLIFFCGFYTDKNCFVDFDNGQSDILFVYDYSSIDCDIFDDFDFTPYSEINLLAYSYGVWVTGILGIKKCLPPINKSLAVCGTFKPIDEIYGINEKIYNIMLNSFCANTIEVFEGKMFQGTEIKKSQRNIENLREELANIKKLNGLESYFDFDTVILSKKDRILPFSSQENQWAVHTHKVILDTGHFPFYEFNDFEEMLNI